jgi:hypothetical protein
MVSEVLQTALGIVQVITLNENSVMYKGRAGGLKWEP